MSRGEAPKFEEKLAEKWFGMARAMAAQLGTTEAERLALGQVLKGMCERKCHMLKDVWLPIHRLADERGAALPWPSFGSDWRAGLVCLAWQSTIGLALALKMQATVEGGDTWRASNERADAGRLVGSKKQRSLDAEIADAAQRLASLLREREALVERTGFHTAFDQTVTIGLPELLGKVAGEHGGFGLWRSACGGDQLDWLIELWKSTSQPGPELADLLEAMGSTDEGADDGGDRVEAFLTRHAPAVAGKQEPRKVSAVWARSAATQHSIGPRPGQGQGDSEHLKRFQASLEALRWTSAAGDEVNLFKLMPASLFDQLVQYARGSVSTEGKIGFGDAPERVSLDSDNVTKRKTRADNRGQLTG